jgi:hypothetical protein
MWCYASGSTNNTNTKTDGRLAMRILGSIALFLVAVCTPTVLLAESPAQLAATPQGKAVLAYYKAAHAGDLAALKKAITAESAKELEGPKGKELVGMLKEMTPSATPEISKVTVTGKTAMVDAKTKEGATTTTDHVRVEMVGSDWKVNTTGK